MHTRFHIDIFNSFDLDGASDDLGLACQSQLLFGRDYFLGQGKGLGLG